MIQNCYTATGTGYSRYKLGAKFVAYKTRIGADSETYKWYSYELGGWLGGTPSSDSRDVDAGESVYSDSGLSTVIGTVSDATVFCSVSMSSVGGGMISTSTPLYGGRYVAAGTDVSFSATASSGKKLMSLSVNGVSYAGPVRANTDLVAVAEFCPLHYTVEDDGTTSGGTHVVAVNGVAVSGSAQADAGDVVSVTATPSSGYSFLYTEIDGVRHVSNPTSFTIVDRLDDGTINVRSAFGIVSSVTNRIVMSGSGAVAVSHDGNPVPVSGGEFAASIGLVYTVTAAPDAGMRVAGFYENGRLVSSSNSYSFVQDSAEREITVVFSAQSEIEVTLFSGPDISSLSETWEGCSCDVVAPVPSVGTYVFTPSAASGFHFVRLYIEDLDGTGKGRVIPAGQSYSVYIDFNARVVAIFAANDSPAEPQDDDQGNATHTTATLKSWEGSDARMTARWRSRRHVFTKPVSFSSARVLTNGYGETLPVITLAAYESPSTSDARETVRRAASQDAFRLPSRRPEKYMEIEVTADARVLEIAVSSSMGGLWQANS